MPSVVCTTTVTVWLLARLNLTVNTALVVPLFPSATVWSSIVSVGEPSSSVIVSTAVAGAPRVAPPVGLASVRVTVSAGSTVVSFTIGTVTVLLVSPPPKLTVVETAA